MVGFFMLPAKSSVEWGLDPDNKMLVTFEFDFKAGRREDLNFSIHMCAVERKSLKTPYFSSLKMSGISS